jgi:hypothetical protein
MAAMKYKLYSGIKDVVEIDLKNCMTRQLAKETREPSIKENCQKKRNLSKRTKRRYLRKSEIRNEKTRKDVRVAKEYVIVLNVVI